MTALLQTNASEPVALAPLAPINAVLHEMRLRLGDAATHGVYPGLQAPGASDGVPASALIDGSRLPDLLDAAKQRWGAAPHAAAALAWKAYTYWLLLPAVVGYGAARRVPLPRPADVIVRFDDHQPFLTIGYRRSPVGVLPSDPIAGQAGAIVLPDDDALLAALRETLFDAHLDPLLEAIRARVNVGRRTLLGSVASGVAYGIARGLPHPDPETAQDLVAALGVADLVDLTPAADGGVEVWRRTCCLAFTLPEPKICSGCCIRPRD